MSIQKINEYYTKVENIKRFSGTNKESSIRRCFAELLSFYAAKKELLLVDEYPIKGTRKIADGGLIDKYSFVYGYWEAKDTQDDLEKEIEKKIKIGYPTFNIIFENSQTAVLFQNDVREQCNISDAKALDKLLNKFIEYQKPEAQEFKKALLQFAKNVPKIIKILENMMKNMVTKEQKNINQEQTYNQEFVNKRQDFLELCKVCINPEIKYADIDEMIIQHILTEDIFKNVFADAQFHEENNIAQSLIEIEKTFFVGDFKREITYKMKSYYELIKEHAQQLTSHKEKQNFLKNLYEEFYKAYNPKNADKLGIVYTPSEVVNFMLKATDYLLEKHFDKNLIDKNVHILDPAAGTGTFITDLLDYLPHNNREKFIYKYKNEIHANEVAILPYYIAYLNIEYTFYAKMQKPMSFDNLCWVDTLDNINALKYKGQQKSLIGGVTAENYKRIQEQNEKPISVIIGNPPYNANQQNENDDNKNREYFNDTERKKGGIDGRIKETYVKESKAVKTKQYDMYKRFFRWASDRISDNGIIAFITNRAFINSMQDDGFRKCVEQEFDLIYIVDLKGDIRLSDGTQGENIFNIMTGVAISFLIRKTKKDNTKNKIHYFNMGDGLTAKDKLEMLQALEMDNIPFETIKPDKNYNWINLSTSDFDTLIPLIQREKTNQVDEQQNTEGYKVKREELEKEVKKECIFEFMFQGINSARDEWVFDFDKNNLWKKINFFADKYNQLRKKHLKKNADALLKIYEIEKKRNPKTKKPQIIDEPTFWDTSIKWSETLKRHFISNEEIKPNLENIKIAHYRPFIKQYYYAEKLMSDRLTQNHYKMFGQNLDKQNKVIMIINHSQLNNFDTFCVDILTDSGFSGRLTPSLPFYLYSENGERKENITDWALDLFQSNYKDKKITKLSIFHYVYAVLHKPEYRQKYEIDLKRDFPRIPLYADFWKYAEAGEKLMDLHLNYENLTPPPPLQMERGSLQMERGSLQMERGSLQMERGSNTFSTSGEKKLPSPNGEGRGVRLNRLPLESLLPKRKKSETSEQENEKLLKKIKPDIKLKAKGGIIEIDELTTISNIPAEVWEYRLGNRSAVEWVLDQYKPYKSSDATIQEHFNTYDFFEYKESVIQLLLQVMYVSVETMKIVKGL